MLIFILLVRLDGILAYLSEEERLSPFFRLKGFLKCPFTLISGPPKTDPVPVWVAGLGGWWTSQKVVRADFLWGRVGAISARQPAFWELPEHRAGGSPVQDQVVCVVPAGTRAHLCWWCSVQGLPCGFWGG